MALPEVRLGSRAERLEAGGGDGRGMNPVDWPGLNTVESAAASPRRGARAVEWAGLENRCARKGTVGSNPTLSAISFLASVTISLDKTYNLR